MKLIPDIDIIAQDVYVAMLRIHLEFSKANSSLTEDFSKGAAMIAFRIGLEYYTAAYSTLSNKNVVGGGALVRTAFENTIDLGYIFSKPNKYPKAYVESMEVFRKALANTADKSHATLAKSREFKQVNQWTKASIEDRIKAADISLLYTYDTLSYYVHPNPGSMAYITDEKVKEKEANRLIQLNCLMAILLMQTIVKHGYATSVTIKELATITEKLDTRSDFHR